MTYRKPKPRKITSNFRASMAEVLDNLDDPTSREKRQFVYEREPFTAADDFDGYPFLYLEDYSFPSGTKTVNESVTDFDAQMTIVIDGRDETAKSKKYHDDLSDQVIYMFLSNQRIELGEHAICFPTIEEDSRTTTVQDTGKPVIRRTLTISFEFTVTMQ